MRRDLDPLAILDALGMSGPTATVPVSGGSDTAIWRVERDGERYALRVFRPEQAEVCRREVVAMAAAEAGGIPAPRMRAAGTWRDRPALLLSWLPGQPLNVVLHAQPWRAAYLGVQFGRMQRAIHAVAAPDALRSGRSWIDWGGADDTLKGQLQALTGTAGSLLHLDYHLLNVLSDGTRITGVLDWANAHSGDRRADVARTFTILRLDAADPARASLPARGVLRLFEWGWRRGYGRAASDDELAAFYAWAGAAMARDLAAKRDAVAIGRIEAWADLWRERALSQVDEHPIHRIPLDKV